ncbi:ubiquinol oxidase subunit II [Oceanobacter mangrovi]|uniref:ubiquinol oxidase subunit II n=1 Tax=Oceanobacter mangrovi TaxID=2862510 RepID=UPI001FEBEE6E|nr:ubiquinol oxidase subunit II [Oceanobacter mangrovi]
MAVFLVAGSVLLSGCSGGILDPKGQVGVDEKNLILIATGLMLLVVIPVIFMTLFFAWKYRASNTQAPYNPEWSHSNKIEAIVWTIPIVIILVLGTITWISTHDLDPYKPLEHDKKPLEIDVVSLNWKWLFIYPEQNIATINELVIPAGRPVSFKLTSESTMNSFFIPQLGSQIYTMAAMTTKLHLIADVPGTYNGFSANYSGSGFSEMKFDTVATSTDAEFDKWVAKVKAAPAVLSSQEYDKLAVPSEGNPVAHYASVKPGLFDDVVMKYMQHHGATPFTDQKMDHMSATSMHKHAEHEGHQATAEESMNPAAMPAETMHQEAGE